MNSYCFIDNIFSVDREVCRCSVSGCNRFATYWFTPHFVDYDRLAEYFFLIKGENIALCGKHFRIAPVMPIDKEYMNRCLRNFFRNKNAL